MSSKRRLKEKRDRQRGAWYAEGGESREFCDSDAMRAGYDAETKARHAAMEDKLRDQIMNGGDC